MKLENNDFKKWTEQEDNFLKQQMDLGLGGSQIYDRFGEILGRTRNAINCRISYLKKPPEERIKEESNHEDRNITENFDRLCNRLDTLIKYQQKIIDELQLLDEREDKRCDSYLKALYEMKTSVCETASNIQTISNYFKRVMHKMKW